MRLNITKLELLRVKKDLSKAAFSRFLGLESSVYGKITEKDGESVTIRTINRIANALNEHPHNLLTR